MKKILLVGLVSYFLFGCAGSGFAPIEHVMQHQLDEKQAQQQLHQGSGKIEGSAFLRQNGGGVVTCAGNNVYLIPYTEYANERITLLYGSNERGYRDWLSTQYKFSGENLNYLQLTKISTCDAQGKFVFSNLSNGTYFLTTKVLWYVGYSQQGGDLMQKVTINGDEVKNIVMSH